MVPLCPDSAITFQRYAVPATCNPGGSVADPDGLNRGVAINGSAITQLTLFVVPPRPDCSIVFDRHIVEESRCNSRPPVTPRRIHYSRWTVEQNQHNPQLEW